jgi:hypothetical protein
MANTKSKISDTQKRINDFWRRFNNIMDECEGFVCDLEELADERDDLDFSKALRIIGEAHADMTEEFSSGARILPSHSADGGKVKDN